MKPFVDGNEMMRWLAAGRFEIEAHEGSVFAEPVDGGVGFVHVADGGGWLRKDLVVPEQLVQQLGQLARELAGLNPDEPLLSLQYAKGLIDAWAWAVLVGLMIHGRGEHGCDIS